MLLCMLSCRGVVAVELEAASVARALLKRYLGSKNFGEGTGVPGVAGAVGSNVS